MAACGGARSGRVCDGTGPPGAAIARQTRNHHEAQEPGPRMRSRIAEDQVVELAEMFRLMSDPTRLRIILACLDAPAAVGEMAERLGISASLVSHHLRLLRAARLLQADRRGRQVFYVVGDEHIRSMLSDMVDHVAEGDAEDGAAS